MRIQLKRSVLFSQLRGIATPGSPSSISSTSRCTSSSQINTLQGRPSKPCNQSYWISFKRLKSESKSRSSNLQTTSKDQVSLRSNPNLSLSLRKILSPNFSCNYDMRISNRNQLKIRLINRLDPLHSHRLPTSLRLSNSRLRLHLKLHLSLKPNPNYSPLRSLKAEHSNRSLRHSRSQ